GAMPQRPPQSQIEQCTGDDRALLPHGIMDQRAFQQGGALSGQLHQADHAGPKPDDAQDARTELLRGFHEGVSLKGNWSGDMGERPKACSTAVTGATLSCDSSARVSLHQGLIGSRSPSRALKDVSQSGSVACQA